MSKPVEGREEAVLERGKLGEQGERGERGEFLEALDS
jgi:hypothetical protein